MKSARRKRSNLKQPYSRLLNLKEMNPILKALLKSFILPSMNKYIAITYKTFVNMSERSKIKSSPDQAIRFLFRRLGPCPQTPGARGWGLWTQTSLVLIGAKGYATAARLT